VQYFTRLAISDADNNAKFADVALVRMYSAPDPELLQRSNHVVLALQLTDTILVIRVKQITGVIAMIPQRMALPSGAEQEMYCMMERPGYDISKWGVPYSIYHEGDDDDVGQDVE